MTVVVVTSNARFTILHNVSNLPFIPMYIAFDDKCPDPEQIYEFNLLKFKKFYDSMRNNAYFFQ